MGMFTTIFAPDGRSCQIKTGWDNCDTYKIGDKIPWTPAPFRPGEGVDGVHLGYGECNNDTLVVIKDCIVAAILPRSGNSLDIQVAMLKADYGLRPPNRSLWSEDAWAEKETRDKKVKEEREQWAKDHAHLTPEEKMTAAMGKYIQQKMDEPNLARRILPLASKMKEEAPPPPTMPSSGIEGFIPGLGATVRECLDCGCLTPGGPTRCKRCAKEAQVGEEDNKMKEETHKATTRCVFHGNPPPPYKTWGECLAAPVIEGLFIRATTPEDYPHSSTPDTTAELIEKEADKLAAEEEIKQSKVNKNNDVFPDYELRKWNWSAKHARAVGFLPGDYQSIEKDLTDLINKQSRENRSNTPDFILAQFMARCLKALEDAITARDSFYGLHPEPGKHPGDPVSMKGPMTAEEEAEYVAKAQKKLKEVEEELTRTPGQMFGRPLVEGAMTDWLNLQKNEKAMERGRLVGEGHAIACNQCKRTFVGPDPMELLCPACKEKDTGRKNTFRYGQIPVDPIIGKGTNKVSVEIGDTGYVLFYDVDPDEGIPLSVILTQTRSDVNRDGLSKATRREITAIKDKKADARLSQSDYEKMTGHIITTTISSCARCGGTHINLNFKILSGEPIGEYTHWSMCENTHEPITLRNIKKAWLSFPHPPQEGKLT